MHFIFHFTKSGKRKGSAKRQTENESNIPTKVRKLLDWAGKSLKSLSEKLNSHETAESSTESSAEMSTENSTEHSAESSEMKSPAMDLTEQTGNGHCLIHMTYMYLLNIQFPELSGIFASLFSYFWFYLRHFHEQILAKQDIS